MSEDSYEYSGFERNCQEVDDGFYLVKNGITYKVDLPMDKTRFTKRINILTGEVYYPSNADRIRAMSVEELAEAFANACPEGKTVNRCCTYFAKGGRGCHDCWLDWLKQEVAE